LRSVGFFALQPVHHFLLDTVGQTTRSKRPGFALAFPRPSGGRPRPGSRFGLTGWLASVQRNGGSRYHGRDRPAREAGARETDAPSARASVFAGTFRRENVGLRPRLGSSPAAGAGLGGASHRLQTCSASD
jgi:hypothetical protein